MRKLMFLLLLISVQLHAQDVIDPVMMEPNRGYFNLSKKERWGKGIGITLSLISGAARGYRDLIHYHYPVFKERHPGANDDWWDPNISWKNKYKDYPSDKRSAYFMSKSLGVVFSDGAHFTNWLNRYAMLGGVTVNFVLSEKRPWWHHALDAVVLAGVHNLGFRLTYK